jgi:sigma-B regulation protein RsbU (phosphoserine phosphatase)
MRRARALWSDWAERLRRNELVRSLESYGTLVRQDTRKAYAFYQRDNEEGEPLPAGGVGRYLAASKALFLSFLRRLNPVRRLSYLAGLLLFAWGFWNDRWAGAALGFLVVNFLLALELAEKLLTKDELEIARAIQFSLYPVSNPDLQHLDLASHFQPAQDVGGDYYDYAVDGNRKFTVILGDVSGKGIPAALYAMKLQALFELLGKAELGPKEMLVSMNDVISERIERNYFITAVVGVIDFQDRRLVLARAGHNHPLLFSARTGESRWLKPSGIGIGMKKKPTFDGLLEELRVPLSPGDVLVFYTDGITEAMNPLKEPFGYARLEALLTECAHLPADRIKEELLKRLDRFRGGEAFGDDVTLVVTKII